MSCAGGGVLCLCEPEVLPAGLDWIRRLSPGRLARLKRKAEAVLLYDAGRRAMRAGDLAAATAALSRSMRTALYDVRQPVMFLASLALRIPFVSRGILLKIVKK